MVLAGSNQPITQNTPSGLAFCWECLERQSPNMKCGVAETVHCDAHRLLLEKWQQVDYPRLGGLAVINRYVDVSEQAAWILADYPYPPLGFGESGHPAFEGLL